MEEMKVVFKSIGEWSEEELAELFAAADTSGDGELQYDEFVDWVMLADDDTKAAVETVWGGTCLTQAIVASLPCDGDGMVTADEELAGVASEVPTDPVSPADLISALSNQPDTEKLFAYWRTHRPQIKKEGNIAIGKQISCETSLEEWCGPALMITGNGCDGKKWIGKEGDTMHEVVLKFRKPAKVTELFLVWGEYTRVGDLTITATLEDGSDASIVESGSLVAEGGETLEDGTVAVVTASPAPDNLSVTFVQCEAPVENVCALKLQFKPAEGGWVSICDLVVHGEAPLPPPPEPAVECDCVADIIDPDRKGAPCDLFKEDGVAAAALSKLQVCVKDGVAVVDAINAKCEEAGGKFVDVEFPAGQASIMGDGGGELGDAARGEGFEQSGPDSWKRITDFAPDAKLFLNKIDMNDVMQGAVGDCWLIAVIASLACTPDHVRGLIYPQTINPHGAYAVRFFSPDEGEWVWVVVDDFVPVGSDERPYFMSAHDPNEFWPVILEKAFAKVNSCYAGLSPTVACGGTCAMRMVSGSNEVLSWVGKDFDGHDVDAVWEEIGKAVAKGCAAACGVADEEFGKHSNEEMKKLGVVYNHVFSCVGTYTLADGTRLLRLRNPWGQGGEWSGAWSDKSEEWTEERKAEVPDFTDKNDGTFFIKVEDFYEYWYRLEICYLEALVPLADLMKGNSA
eukprot:CAMPEP_0172698368 /NCGR_PEP_ID=MMETSP1074-20121228/29426_1 /TAXON_ID=2916 /ORGANISM="Ceratium fusus, Strain PA161109" /LENGTH=682 /DNA_ID=CAMNT_0013519399 /DNA_START=75 /DNA_END=2123 /DNA_ORIENTATION=+